MKKVVKQKSKPKNNSVVCGENPEHFYSLRPAWAFANADQELWPFSMGNVEALFWTEILPRLKGLETQTWGEILVKKRSKKNNIFYTWRYYKPWHTNQNPLKNII